MASDSNSSQQKIWMNKNKQKSFPMIYKHLKSKLRKKYNISQDHLYSQLINKLLPNPSSGKRLKKKRHQSINVKDIGFDEEDEFMDKLYSFSQISSQFPELFEYYKYYTQEPIIYLKGEFDIMIDYQDRKKAFVYNRLKNVLELSDTVKTISELQKINKKDKNDKKVHEVGNILTFLNKHESLQTSNFKTEKENESYYFQEISQKLIQFYGLSRIKTLSKIDKHFKLFSHNVSIQRHKKISELCKTPTLKTTLQSTNISTKNANVKKNKKIQHKRYGSTQFGSESQTFKVKFKRWTSTEGIQTEKQDMRREKSGVRRYNKTKTKVGDAYEIDIKENIEEMRRKIKREKKVVYQTSSGSRFIRGRKK